MLMFIILGGKFDFLIREVKYRVESRVCFAIFTIIVLVMVSVGVSF